MEKTIWYDLQIFEIKILIMTFFVQIVTLASAVSEFQVNIWNDGSN